MFKLLGALRGRKRCGYRAPVLVRDRFNGPDVYRKWRRESWTGTTKGWTGANWKGEPSPRLAATRLESAARPQSQSDRNRSALLGSPRTCAAALATIRSCGLWWIPP